MGEANQLDLSVSKWKKVEIRCKCLFCSSISRVVESWNIFLSAEASSLSFDLSWSSYRDRMWTFWNRPKKAAQVLFLWALFWQLFPAGLLCIWDNKSMESQFMKNISGMQFVQWELILRSTLSFDNSRQRLWGLWDCAWCAWKIPCAQELCNESISMGTIWIGELPCVWSYTQNCGFQILITWMFFFFFSGGFMSVYVHGDFTHAVNEVFVFVCFCLVFKAPPKVLLQPIVQNSMRTSFQSAFWIDDPPAKHPSSWIWNCEVPRPVFFGWNMFLSERFKRSHFLKVPQQLLGQWHCLQQSKRFVGLSSFWFPFFFHRSCLYKMGSKTS